MVELKEKLEKALEELRKENEPKKFVQTVDLIINLQKFDLKKTQINTFVFVPHKVKEKKICAFLEVNHKTIPTIVPADFRKYANKKEIKKLVGNYDFFIAQASLMPQIATNFGRVLGPAGKMPSPQLGILMNTDEKTLNEVMSKINQAVKIKIKEPSLKVAIAKENMKNEEIIENILLVYNNFLKILPKGKENIKNIEVKFTMTKPKKIKLD
jgi:large subunit ribosomal protein L1